MRVVALAAAMALAATWAGSAAAATFKVDSGLDLPDLSAGDGVCDAGDGLCTLRAAVDETNALAGADTILVPPQDGPYQLDPLDGDDANEGGDLDVHDDLTIQGTDENPGAVAITGGFESRVLDIFNVLEGDTVLVSDVTVRDLTIQHGGGEPCPDVCEDPTQGGLAVRNRGDLLLENVAILSSSDSAAEVGGGLANAGNATLRNARINSNSAGGSGGGVYNYAQSKLTVEDSNFTGNRTGDDGGAIYNGGGHVFISGSRFVENSATSSLVEEAEGGALANFLGSATIDHSHFADNGARSGGGAIYHGIAQTLAVRDTTIHGNRVEEGNGGGIWTDSHTFVERSTISGNTAREGGAILNLGPLSVENSTLSRNHARDSGGGIYNAPVEGNSARFEASTIAFNVARDTDTEQEGEGGGVFNAEQSEISMVSTIVMGGFTGEGRNCAGDLSGIQSDGWNMEPWEECPFFGPNDFGGFNPELDENLQDNGGPTQTHALNEGSPAIDVVPPNEGEAQTCMPTDQRGVVRPVGDACDIGAFEFGDGGGGETFVVDDDRVECPTATHTTIQSAIDDAPDGTTIQVCAGLYREDVAVHNLVTLQGPGSNPTEGCSTWGPADPTRDAIVDGDSVGLSLQVSGIVVDGLVVLGSVRGIESSPEFSGFQILDNVIVENTFGVELDSSGDAPSLVSRNCFAGNTRAGLHGDHLSNASIDHNTFVVDAESGSEVWGVFLGRIECCGEPGLVGNVSVNDNLATGADGNKRFTELSHTADVDVRRNTAAGFGSAVIFLANGNERTVVADNDLSKSHLGVWVSDIAFAGGTRNLGITISGNQIGGMGTYGIGVEAGNSLNDSSISENTISDSGVDGIRFQAGENGGNSISSNTISGSVEHDCHDDTTGSGTAGTANTWADNTAATSQPAGLCGDDEPLVADVAVTKTDDPDPVAAGSDLTYTIVVANTGGATAESVTLVDTLPAGVVFKSASSTAGSSCTGTATVTCQIGALPPGNSATVTIVVVPQEGGTLTNTATATTTSVDPNALNDSASEATTVTPPTVSIANASATEGDTGQTAMTFTLTRSTTVGVSTVTYATSDGTATAGEDYEASGGTVLFEQGDASQTVTVNVLGDTTDESDETFTVTLTAGTNASITGDPATGTIVDDDADTTRLSIGDATVTEGNSGTVAAVFTVTRTGTGEASVSWATADGSAGSADYTSASGSLSFSAEETSKTISISVLGDTLDEADETFFVNLSEPSSATIEDGQGTGTIVDDDDPVTPPPGPITVAGPCSEHGTLRDDQLTGSSADDWMCGWRGADTLLGLFGADRLLGGDGDDLLDGGFGADALDGGYGNDVIDAYGEGVDEVEGGPGFDTCYCGPEDDVTGIELFIPHGK